jgi:serine/threonine protein kinase/Flp pilus assembly protein TadD
MTDLQQHLDRGLAGRYVIDRQLGEGGMAVVFLARDLRHDRRVALKVLRPEISAEIGAERFLREIKMAAGLTHPHILPVYDSGEADGLLFYVMPNMEGNTLRERLNAERQIAIPEALRITREVATALDYAHRNRVIHRDIKPENILLHEGNAMVADFGIGKALSSTATVTQTGLAVGTPAYMSPEQASGDHEIDGRSDIYSLGCVLYEMLTGEVPFTGPTAQAIIAKRFISPVPHVKAMRDVPDGLDELVTRALARAPVDRFATAGQLADAIGGSAGLQHTPPELRKNAPAAKSVAVLPFTDMSPEKDQDYFTDGIAEEIINALSKIQTLRVASRSSAFAFKGKGLDIREVGEKLGVSTVLEGSVRKAGNRLRITAQLVNAADGYHLWSDRFDRELADVFAVQDEIADNIVKALRVVLSDNEKRAIEQARPENFQAYEYYLRGRQFVHQYREKSLQFARRMFQRAIEVDPNFARAYAGLADLSSMLYQWWDASDANLSQAETASRKALELAPDLAAAHASRGFAMTLKKQYPEAEQAFEVALKLDPMLFEAYYFYARTCFQQGKLEQAAKLFEKASEVRPEDFQAQALCSQVYAVLGRTADDETARRRTIEKVGKHLELNPDDARALYLGAGALAKEGNREKALRWLERARAVDPEDSAVLYNVGCVYALLGEADHALECLELAVVHGYGHKEWMANDSDLDSLRQLPRFDKLLASI